LPADCRLGAEVEGVGADAEPGTGGGPARECPPKSQSCISAVRWA